jgi:hypothetical protein
MKFMMREVTEKIQKIAGKKKNNSKVFSIVDFTRSLLKGTLPLKDIYGAKLYVYPQGCEGHIC